HAGLARGARLLHSATHAPADLGSDPDRARAVRAVEQAGRGTRILADRLPAGGAAVARGAGAGGSRLSAGTVLRLARHARRAVPRSPGGVARAGAGRPGAVAEDHAGQ